MKILLVSFYYYPELGAAPSRITNMAEGFIAEGAEVDVLMAIEVVCIKRKRQGKARYSAIGLMPQCQKIR